MSDPIVFIDTETTGLDPARHELWDIALIEADGTEHEWHLRPQHPDRADPGALRVNRFYERTSQPGWKWATVGPEVSILGTSLRTPGQVAADIVLLTANKHIAGIVPSFDADFLSAFLIANGQREAWHYHLVDVEEMAVGYLRGRQRRAGRSRGATLQLPWDTGEIAHQLGIDLTQFEKHTAIGDARLARTIYLAVMGE